MDGMGVRMGGPGKWSERQDAAFDKKAGIKENSAIDKRVDKMMMTKSAMKADMRQPKIKGRK